MSPQLRPARVEDASMLAKIWHEGWGDGHLGQVPDALVAARTSASFEERTLARIADMTVAVVDDTVAGFVIVDGDEVEQVYVDRAYRGRVVAPVLLAEAERQVAAAGHTRSWLAVAPGNLRARRFYERSGWVDAGGFTYEAEVAGGRFPVPCRRYEKQVAQSTPPSAAPTA
ncbi:GNAT family N-acetyltransferase [Mumia sp. zg.B53]|uniref:GNAT family N-acetyltransferase n=1 Tax=Mumia sp. zg.B53 TaxID=2855449 RepID=UPI001C6ED42B|nr:GNAT family N-acetyltransferase [Mumia sp. zg.B53]MBW9214170.1 GNAT family N-acetyltransferase [Mumia sp. zg.B53]